MLALCSFKEERRGIQGEFKGDTMGIQGGGYKENARGGIQGEYKENARGGIQGKCEGNTSVVIKFSVETC
jgi:hypothetical protein